MHTTGHCAPDSLPPVPHQEGKRRAAMAEAYVLQWTPLIQARDNKHTPCHNDVCTPHRLGEQTGSVESKLHRCRGEAENCPHEHVAAGEKAREIGAPRPNPRVLASWATSKIVGPHWATSSPSS